MKYDAFISYRHTEPDLYIAKKVHKGLETLRIPRAVAKKTGKKKINRVFRDQEELPIGSDLGDNIESALAQSEYLLVICSPRTPESYWVQKEIDTFIRMHGREHILAVLVEGEPEQSFPAQLLTDDEGNPVEPLAADVRGSSKREMTRKLKTEILRLAAPLLGCTYDELRQRHKERKMKQLAMSAAVVAVFALLFGAYSTYNATLIRQNYEGKQRNQSKYLAETSLRLLENGDRRAAVLVALEALPSEDNDRPYVAEAQYALSRALYSYDTGLEVKPDRVLPHDLPVDNFCLNADATKAVTVDEGGSVYVWNIQSGERLAWIPARFDDSGYIKEIKGVMLHENNIIICENDCIRSVDFNGQELWNVNRPEGTGSCEFEKDLQLAVCRNNDEITFYDYTTGEIAFVLYNEEELSFQNTSAFNKNKTKYAIAHINSKGESNCVTVYDLEEQESTVFHIEEGYISAVAFGTDDNLLITSARNEDLAMFVEEPGEGFIQKIDLQTQKVLWKNSYKYQRIGYETASVKLDTRCYTDEISGAVCDEVLMTVDNKAYTFDNSSGTVLSEITVENGITNLLVSEDSGYAYLAQADGTIDFVDLSLGMKYSGVAIEIGKEVLDVDIRKGYIVYRSYVSSDLGIMKYPENRYAEIVDEFDHNINYVDFSEDESYYAVVFYDYEADNRVCFYRTKDNSRLNEWVDNEEESYIELSAFSDKDTYVLGYANGILKFYNIETGNSNVLTVLDEQNLTLEYSVSGDGKVAMIYNGVYYALVDLQKQKILEEKEIIADQGIGSAVLSNDGSRAYCTAWDNTVIILDTKTGELSSIEGAEYQVIDSTDATDVFTVSNNGDFVAISCNDGMLRIFNAKQMETIAEIPFSGISRRFVKFLKNDTQILMQGEDYFLKVYDLEAKGFAYISTNQYYEILEMEENEANNVYTIITTSDMTILNREDYERTASIDGGICFLPGKNVILSGNYKTLYEFPYMTLDMLRKEAHSQFGKDKLSDLEKIRYHVE